MQIMTSVTDLSVSSDVCRNCTFHDNCYKRVINESPRGDSLCHNDDVTWTC